MYRRWRRLHDPSPPRISAMTQGAMTSSGSTAPSLSQALPKRHAAKNIENSKKTWATHGTQKRGRAEKPTSPHRIKPGKKPQPANKTDRRDDRDEKASTHLDKKWTDRNSTVNEMKNSWLRYSKNLNLWRNRRLHVIPWQPIWYSQIIRGSTTDYRDKPYKSSAAARRRHEQRN